MSRRIFRSVVLAAAVLAAWQSLRAESVALGSFSHADLERNDPDTSAAIATLLQAAIGDTPGRTFVERQEAQKLMDELGLAALEGSDAESASRIGKLLGADVMLTGTFSTSEGGAPYVVLETTELARAEPLGQARVELGNVLERGRLSVPGKEDMKKIAAAAAALLDESRDKVAAGRKLVSIKFLGFAHDYGDAKLRSFGARLESAIDSAAAATGKHRVLSLERADVASQESEFTLLGLAEADDHAYEKAADYFVWASVDSRRGPAFLIRVWDGRHPPLEFREPLDFDPSREAAAAARLAAKVIAAAVPAGTESFTGPSLCKGIARIFLDQEQSRENEGHNPGTPGTAAARRLEEERLLSAAIFFNPASSEAWFRLQRLRMPPAMALGRVNDIKGEVQALQFTLEAAKRFLVAPGGRIDPTPLDEFFGAQSPQYADRFRRLRTDVTLLEEDFHDIYLSHNIDAVFARLSSDYRTSVMQLCRELAAAAPGQEDAYRRCASALLFTIFENDFPKADRVAAVSTLGPRLKVALLVHRAWYPNGERLEAIEPLVRSELIDEGKKADEEAFDTLSPEELAQAERSVPAEGSPAADQLTFAAMEARTLASLRNGPAAAMAVPIQRSLDRIAAFRAEAERLRRPAMRFLECHAAGWTWTPGASTAFLAEQPDKDVGLFNPPLESLRGPQRAAAVAWLRQEAASVVSKGYPPAIAEALKAKADAVEAAPEPPPAPGEQGQRSLPMPRYMDPEVGPGTLWIYASKGDIGSLDSLFKEGVPPAYAGKGLAYAVVNEQWPAAHFILDSGYDPAAPWPDPCHVPGPDLGATDTPGRIALAAAILAGHQELTEILLKKGIRFGPDGSAAAQTIAKLAMRRDSGALRQILAAGGHTGNLVVSFDGPSRQPLYYALHFRDPDLLGVLLDLGCNVREPVISVALSHMKASNMRQWIDQDPEGDSALGFAARTNWLEGARILIDKRRQELGSTLSGVRMDRYATDPAVRSLLVREELRSMGVQRPDSEAGIALFAAIAAGDSSAFESAVTLPGSIGFRGFYNETALMFAIEEEATSFAGRLIDAGASVDATDYDGSTPLCYAAAAGNAEIAEALVRHGANPNGHGGSAPPPLEMAIGEARDASLAIRLVGMGASLSPNPSRPGFNPLFRAAWEDMPGLVTKLMALGADPQQTAMGHTIMFSAAHSNDPDLIQMLFDKGCDPNRRAPNGWTPLTTAVRWGAADSVRKLLELGVRDPHAAAASVSMVTDLEPPDRPKPAELRRLRYVPDYQRCVETMAEFGQLGQSQEAGDGIFWHSDHTVEEIEAHLAAGGNVNYLGAMTPLQLVLGNLDAAKAKLLLDHGADPNLSGQGIPPLDKALDSPALTRLLLDHGADPNRTSTMWYAINEDNVPLESVRMLVDAGGTLGIGGEQTLTQLAKRNPARAEAVRRILSGGQAPTPAP